MSSKSESGNENQHTSKIGSTKAKKCFNCGRMQGESDRLGAILENFLRKPIDNSWYDLKSATKAIAEEVVRYEPGAGEMMCLTMNANNRLTKKTGHTGNI